MFMYGGESGKGERNKIKQFFASSADFSKEKI